MQPGQRKRRRRGVILTETGLKKFQVARADAEFVEKGGHKYTLEDLSERTELSVDTLMKVLGCELRVDRQTLKNCFRAFNLNLESGDYEFPEALTVEESQPSSYKEISDQILGPPLPEGQVPLDSKFYVEQFSPDHDCFKAIFRPGALLRIKGARRTGKTSLTARMADFASQNGCHSVFLSLQQADKKVFLDIDKLLQWFCATVGLVINVSPAFDTYWDERFLGSKVSCTRYFEQYLLMAVQHPLVLVLDDVDQLFQYPELADDFFGLLRTWHESAKNRKIWQTLRLIVVHTTDVYIPINVNKSPFNVGLPLELAGFTPKQVQTLARCYQVSWSLSEAQALCQFLGGQPYLVQLALYCIWKGDTTLIDLLQITDNSISLLPNLFLEHLQRQLWTLQQRPDLAKPFARVIAQKAPVELALAEACQLQGMGLIKVQGRLAEPYCPLYQQYFHGHLSIDS